MASSCLPSSGTVRRTIVAARMALDPLPSVLNGQPFFDETFGIATPDPAKFPEPERGDLAAAEQVSGVGAAAPQEVC
jgi:hypothetical protein